MVSLGGWGGRGGILPDCKQAGLFNHRCVQVCSLRPGLWLKGLADSPPTCFLPVHFPHSSQNELSKMRV